MLLPNPAHLLLKSERHSSSSQFVTVSSEDEHEALPDCLVNKAAMRLGKNPRQAEVGVEHLFHLLTVCTLGVGSEPLKVGKANSELFGVRACLVLVDVAEQFLRHTTEASSWPPSASPR